MNYYMDWIWFFTIECTRLLIQAVSGAQRQSSPQAHSWSAGMAALPSSLLGYQGDPIRGSITQQPSRLPGGPQ